MEQTSEKTLKAVSRNITVRPDGAILITDRFGRSSRWLVGGTCLIFGLVIASLAFIGGWNTEPGKDSRAALLFGVPLVLLGITSILWQNRFLWDRGANCWRLERGIERCWVRAEEGAINKVAGLSCYIDPRRLKRRDARAEPAVWSVSLVFQRETGRPPLLLFPLEIPGDNVPGKDAAALIAMVADAMGVPLLKGAYAADVPVLTSSLWTKRASAIALAVGVITLVNSYADGVALVHGWTDARGARFLYATNFWREEWRSRAAVAGGRETQRRYTVFLHPWGYRTEGSKRDLAESIRPARESRWWLGRCSTAITAFETERYTGSAGDGKILNLLERK